MADDPVDDELTHLIVSVRDVFGERACIAALDKVEALLAGGRACCDADACAFAYCDALKAELRRLLRPH
jgi:hypothetical protein